MSIEFHVHLFPFISAGKVILPYAFSSAQWPLSSLIKYFNNSTFYSLSWEQLLTPINMHYKKPRDKFIRESMQHLAWSQDYKKFLMDNFVLEKNITIVGNVSNELLELQSEQASKIKQTLALEYSVDMNANWIFMPMNYAWAFVTDSNIKGKISKGYDPINAWKYRDYAKSCLDEFVFFIDDVAKNNLESLIIIRPHPSISIEKYLDLFKRSGIAVRSNIVFTKKYSIREWIAVSDVVGSSWSSSVWDAVQAGKRGFLFTPLPKPSWHKVWWESEVLNVTNANELDFQSMMCSGVRTSSLGVSKKTAEWLARQVEKQEVSEKYTIKILNFISRMLRSFLRSISMKYFKGILIDKGLQRDFFDPTFYNN
jgi:hypothetical protein